MDNPRADFAHHVTSGVTTVYNSCQKVVSEMGSKSEENTSDTHEKSKGWFADIMADLILNGDGSSSGESIKDGENHHGGRDSASVEGYAESSGWLLVGHRRVSYEQFHLVNPAGGRLELESAPDGAEAPAMSQRSNGGDHPLDTQGIQRYNRRKRKRYTSRLDGSEIPGRSQQGHERNCLPDTPSSRTILRPRGRSAADEMQIPTLVESPPKEEMVSHVQDIEEFAESNGHNKKRSQHPNSGISRLMAMTDSERQADMDSLIVWLNDGNVRDSWTTVDGEEQPEPEGSPSRPEGTITTDTADRSSWDIVPEPAGEASNPTSTSPLDKTPAPGCPGKKLKAKVKMGWKKFFK
ncbi:hypothetical protein F4801DRAFT_574088 [Xylaria longipes]|nr:hypothetical protein F4801DRAFT_574088 [Xylaria longipes]